jgi:hypothetical protein
VYRMQRVKYDMYDYVKTGPIKWSPCLLRIKDISGSFLVTEADYPD